METPSWSYPNHPSLKQVSLKNHGSACQPFPLPPPSCTEAAWTRLTSCALLPQEFQDWGAGKSPSQHSWAQPCSSIQRLVGMSWVSLWPVGRAPSPQDLARTGVKPCLKGTGGTDHAGQFPQPPSPPVVTCHGSWGSSPLPVPAPPQPSFLSDFKNQQRLRQIDGPQLLCQLSSFVTAP